MVGAESVNFQNIEQPAKQPGFSIYWHVQHIRRFKQMFKLIFSTHNFFKRSATNALK